MVTKTTKNNGKNLFTKNKQRLRRQECLPTKDSVKRSFTENKKQHKQPQNALTQKQKIPKTTQKAGGIDASFFVFNDYQEIERDKKDDKIIYIK